MQNIIDEIRQVFASYSKEPVLSVEKIPQSGSDRFYFRVFTGTGSYIATYGKNIKENNTFINFSNHFRKAQCPVPEILVVNDTQTIYLQQDFGDVSEVFQYSGMKYDDQWQCPLKINHAPSQHNPST